MKDTVKNVKEEEEEEWINGWMAKVVQVVVLVVVLHPFGLDDYSFPLYLLFSFFRSYMPHSVNVRFKLTQHQHNNRHSFSNKDDDGRWM